MSSFEDLSFSASDFSGTVRLFPLPNLVLFPHVMQPLHIFEPRYRQLLEDALAGDRLIAMALLAPGWETDYEGCPPIHPVACLARITTYHQLEDGTYNLLVLGVQRVRIVEELDSPRPYREATVELCEAPPPANAGPSQGSLQKRLREAFVQVLPSMPEAREQMDQLLATDMPLGVLTDVISFMLDIGMNEKQALLSELDVCRRAELLLAHFATAAGDETASTCGKQTFPPHFSVN